MASSARTVLITGCSEGGLGDGLAQAFHKRGVHVFATARSPAKMAHLVELGITTLPLDVLSAESIAACVAAVSAATGGSLDMLVNNAGGGYSMPLLDADLDEARGLFDTNVWGLLAVTQAFVPLLLKSQRTPTVVNNTSVASLVGLPTTGVYSMSKAAAAMLTDVLRYELAPFSIHVTELKTAVVRTRFFSNQSGGSAPRLPPNSLYAVARKEVEDVMTGDSVMQPGVNDTHTWAAKVVGDLLGHKNPPWQIWRGTNATLIWLMTLFPRWWFTPFILKTSYMSLVQKRWKAKEHKE